MIYGVELIVHMVHLLLIPVQLASFIRLALLTSNDLRTFAPKMFPSTDFFLFATQKGNNLLLPKWQKMGDHLLSFAENIPARIS